MAKDTFYFSHDYNTRSDEKIKLLIRKHGMLGYGIFWSIIEDLYNNANAMRTDYEGIAFDLHSDKTIVKSVICGFDLFVFDGDFFGSLSVERRLNERNEKSLNARKSALYRWGKVKEDANAMRTLCEGNAIKERKVKEIKERKEIKEIDIDEIYSAYPSKCLIKNSSTGKSLSDKEKIKSLLLNNSKDYILLAIKNYVSDCKVNHVYMKNFKTFLNNIPDFELPAKEKTKYDFKALFPNEPLSENTRNNLILKFDEFYNAYNLDLSDYIVKIDDILSQPIDQIKKIANDNPRVHG